jgi:hypothetical protein
MNPLAGWQNFYVIVGSSAGALIGLQFVVMSLITNMVSRTDPGAGQAFATPTIVHFGTVLGLSAFLCAPWDGPGSAAIFWGAVGMAGVFYTTVVVRRMRTQKAYRPEFEDWLFHAILPCAAYLTLALSTYTAAYYLREALFAVAAAVMLLLFVGIHNAWDAVVYHVFVQRKQ